MSQRAPRKRKAAPETVSPLAGRKARVSVERAGCCIVVDDVNAVEAGVVAADLLRAFRALGRAFPELREFPDVVPGGSPVDVPEDDDWEGHRPRRVGFGVKGS